MDSRGIPLAIGAVLGAAGAYAYAALAGKSGARCDSSCSPSTSTSAPVEQPVMKKIINDPQLVVKEMLEGIVMTQPNTRLITGGEHLNIIVRADIDEVKESQVTLISGGGSGHEPAHAGFVGDGMLSAAVCGGVFSSPSWAQVYAAIKAVAGPKGVLLIIKNYTGDFLQFSMAKEFAEKEGVKIELVVVADDVALLDKIDAKKARGLAGTVFVHKIAGALAKRGASLHEVAEAARHVAAKVRTMGVALSPCTIPAVGTPSFTLGPREIGFGLGIHGEPGQDRKYDNGLVADLMVEQMLNSLVPHVATGSSGVIVLLNNLGSTTSMEMSIAGRALLADLSKRKIKVVQILSAMMMTSLEMAGISISMLPVDAHADLLSLLNDPCQVVAWPKSGATPLPLNELLRDPPPLQGRLRRAQKSKDAVLTPLGTRVRRVIVAVCEKLIAQKGYLTELDQQIGDGDMGVNVADACATILAEIDSYPFGDDLHATFINLTYSLRYYGGSSGALLGTFFSRVADAFYGEDATSIAAWSKALSRGVEGILERGNGKPGMKTMIDALIPAQKSLAHVELSGGLSAERIARIAADAAANGAEETRAMESNAGRSQYVPNRGIGFLDPGAVMIAIVLETIAEVLGKEEASKR